MTEKKIGICVITHPFPSEIVGHALLSNFVHILHPLSDRIYVLTGIDINDVPLSNVYPIYFRCTRKPILVSCIKFTISQIKMSIRILYLSKNVSDVIFFVGGTSLILPLFVSRLLKKNIISIITASDAIKIEHSSELFGSSRKILSYLTDILEHINYRYSDKLVLYSESTIEQLNLNQYISKISPDGSRYVDDSLFYKKINFMRRDRCIGYIGRLSEEKGIINFIHAMTIVLKKHHDIKFLIVGDGILMDTIVSMIELSFNKSNIEIVGSVQHENIGDYLNKIKLLVIPSYTETGPQIALESMACGTPILATKVGLIPNIINNFQNGYILENNDPETIAEGMLHALNNPHLSEISENAIDTIKKKYSYDSAVERYNIILNIDKNIILSDSSQ